MAAKAHLGLLPLVSKQGFMFITKKKKAQGVFSFLLHTRFDARLVLPSSPGKSQHAIETKSDADG